MANAGAKTILRSQTPFRPFSIKRFGCNFCFKGVMSLIFKKVDYMDISIKLIIEISNTLLKKIFYLFTIALLTSCLDTPNSSTIISGKVTDANNLPVPNVNFFLTGFDTKGGISGTTTFENSIDTDTAGNFRFESVYPRKTDFVELSAASSSSIDFLNTWDLYIERNGNFDLFSSPEQFDKKEFGKTHFKNFQIRKRGK